MSRVYRDIMEEVIRSLEEHDFDNYQISSIKKKWFQHLNNPVDIPKETEIMEGEQTRNFMICLYEKVSKNKLKFRTQLKQGFINIGHEDYAFLSGNGDLDW